MIGIDDYSRADAARARGLMSLRGAVRDVDRMQEMLIAKYGFQRHEIAVLKNRQATRDRILASIDEQLIAPVRKGDIAVFYYSGHGSQAPNSLSPEADKRDETIVAADGLDIHDKKLRVLFNQVLDRGASLTVIFDSCHSGSIIRELHGLLPDFTVRGVAASMHDVKDPTTPVAPEDQGALVLSASSDFGRSYERQDEKGQYHGIFTDALIDAMQVAPRRESASDTFLRAQAMMRAGSPFQNPVIGGTPIVKLTPLFATDPNDVPDTPPIAIEEITSDGVVKLQGGWAQGLTEGTVLRLRGDESNLRIRVEAITNFGRSEGSVVTPRGVAGEALPPSGALLEIAAWAPPASRVLRVWIPQTDDLDSARTFVDAVRAAAKRASVEWVDDPTEKTPTHVLRWRDSAWEIHTADGQLKRIDAHVDANDVIAQLAPGSLLFVQLPASTSFARAINIGRDTDHNNVERTEGPADADYVLVGRLREKTLEYAWIRPAAGAADAQQTPLPARSDWYMPVPVREASILLQHSILRLYKVLAWYFVPSPPHSPSPYRLVLEPRDGNAIENRKVIGMRKYMLTLQALEEPLPPVIQPRYYYVFGIDSFGASHLLYPPYGSVENRFPISPTGANPLSKIPLRSITMKPPYGVDTYFLISTDESIPNPEVLQWTGARTRGPKGQTLLEDFLSRTGGSSRSMQGDAVPAKWSIDHQLFESVPPQ